MTTLQKKLDKISDMIDQRAEREKRDEELRHLLDQLLDINKKIKGVLLPGKFYIDLGTGEMEFQERFKPALNTYLGLQSEIVKEWGEKPNKIDLLDPKELKEGLQEFSTEISKLEDSLREHLRNTSDSVANEKKTAQTIAQILPDIKIDLDVFVNAQAYFQRFGQNPTVLASYLNASGKRSEKISTWKNHLKAVHDQHDQMDFKKSTNLSDETATFLDTLIKSKRVWFKDLSPSVLTEINTTFPELSQKLVVKVFQND
jgi:hypothetical protein